MIGKTTPLLLSLGCLLALTLQSSAADQPAASAPPKPGPDAPPSAVATQNITIDKIDYRLSGPFNHENLSVYLIHAPAQVRKDDAFLTLDEGLRRGLVTVHEKKGGGSVQELIIENKSNDPLYLQEGDRLSGGQQDRTVQYPLVIKPRSGPQALPTFCIEQSRWKQSNPENKFVAGASSASAPKDVRLAAKFRSNQAEVWHSVRMNKEQYAASLSIQNTNSSLNESLDSATAKAAAAVYTNPLQKLIEDQKDVVGVAFALNGQVEEVNIYSGQPLLAKMFPRLLESYAMEAAAGEGARDGGAAMRNELNERIATNLSKRLDTRYNGMNFEQVLGNLQTAIGSDFDIDWTAIEKAGIKRTKRIVHRVRNIPADEALTQILDFASGRDKTLSYTIAQGKVHISDQDTIAQLKDQKETEITQPPRDPSTITAPDLDAIAAFMSKGLTSATNKTSDRNIDGYNKMQIIDLSDRYFARSVVGNTVIHRQWMRAGKDNAGK